MFSRTTAQTGFLSRFTTEIEQRPEDPPLQTYRPDKGDEYGEG